MMFFKFEEFRCQCCGGLPPLAKENIESLVDNVLDPLREKYGKPIKVNSGYRCPKHNLAVGGATQSQHMKGEAADIAPMDGDARELERLVEIIKQNGKWDQMIVYPTFVHVSWKRFGPNRKQTLRKVSNGYQKV